MTSRSRLPFKTVAFFLSLFVVVVLLMPTWKTWFSDMETTDLTAGRFGMSKVVYTSYASRAPTVIGDKSTSGNVTTPRGGDKQLTFKTEERTPLSRHVTRPDVEPMLRELENRLTTSDIGPPSDSSCLLMNPRAPDNLGREGLKWVCNFSRTFVYQDRERRTLSVQCKGAFKVNFVDREENDRLRPNGKYVEDPVWKEYVGPAILPFPSKYVDVVCNDQHNYRTQLVPDVELEARQREIYNKFVESKPDLKPLSILSVSIDSVSRSQMYRPFGLPRTAALLKRLYYASVDSPNAETGRNSRLSHRAFLFNRVNSISGFTAMNLVPMYSGETFTIADERERVRNARFPRNVKEWVWQYAAKRGYITSYAVDTGNGLFGTRTVCKECHYRPGCLPHWEHGWVKKENTVLGDGVLSGFCEGDAMTFDYIMNYTRQVLQRDHPAKWTAFDLAVHHRPEAESAIQVDESMSTFLEAVLQENSNLVVFLFGDHGKPYTKYPDRLGGYYETLLPFFSILLPLHVVERRPDFTRNLLENSQRLISFFDVHTTAKSLMHYPHVEDVGGYHSREGINLLTTVISPHRICAEAGIPDWACVCDVVKAIPEHEWSDDMRNIVAMAIENINKQHRTPNIESSEQKTTCQDVQLKKIHSVYVNDYARKKSKDSQRPLSNEVEYIITFEVVQGPATFKVSGSLEHGVMSLKQMSGYVKYEDCHDKRVSIEFCICENFPDVSQTK